MHRTECKGWYPCTSIFAYVCAYFRIHPRADMLAAFMCTNISGFCRRVHELPCVHGFMWVGVYLDLGGRCMPMHGMKARVRAPVRWGLCLDRSCRCTVQGHRRQARASAMCVHSCVSWPQAGWTPRAPSAPAERAALFLRRGRPRGLLAPRPGLLGPAVIGGQAGGSAPSRAGGAGSRYRRRGVGVVEGAPGHPSSVITA